MVNIKPLLCHVITMECLKSFPRRFFQSGGGGGGGGGGCGRGECQINLKCQTRL